MIKDYKGLKVVVTGAANGIGKALALGCGKRGSDVIVVDIHGDEAAAVAEEIRGFGVEAYSLGADVSLSSECQKIFDFTMEKFGRCDFLINNAGVSTGGDVVQISENDIKWVYETNVYSHWFMMKLFIPQMRKQGNHCQILNVCSIAGIITMGASPVYFSSKHAAVALNEVVYKQLKAAGDDIDLAIFCPGFLQTEMWLTDRHRPERYAIDPDDPYYQQDWYQDFIKFNKHVLDTGLPLEPTIEKVFDALGTTDFYILTHDQYEKLVREQGNFIADKVQPADSKLLK